MATYEQGDQLVHEAKQVLLAAEVVSPSNRGPKWIRKGRLYATAGIPWYLLVEAEEDGTPSLILLRLDGPNYVEEARAVPGEVLHLPEPLGPLDPADLLERRR